MTLGALGRLILAAVCTGVLIAARWHREQQLSNAPRPARSARQTRASEPLGRRLPHLRSIRVSQPLYWIGLTTSAALAAQAIASLISESGS